MPVKIVRLHHNLSDLFPIVFRYALEHIQLAGVVSPVVEGRIVNVTP